ncbi:hypothetical protein E8E13_010131 [Curvularia kusanoi]|uniref:Uncharacterized protein n=1 Tax=Curvularia kusanoi TaxID=90978 RepID=A0A9P4TNT7_CURKU|nr:hypothetical protein E8E13_010131 [Curvularia kusanoi]
MQHRSTTPYPPPDVHSHPRAPNPRSSGASWPPPDVHPALTSTAGPRSDNVSARPWPPPDVHSTRQEYPYAPSSQQQQQQHPPSYPLPRSHTAAPPAATRHAHAHSPTNLPPGSAALRDARHRRAPSAPLTEPLHHSHRDLRPTTPPPRPPFLIIGLFALRLTHTVIKSLPAYPSRTSDLNWLDSFLAPYDPSYDLAVLRGEQREEYEEMYPRIVGRMKKEGAFPRAFASVDPRGRYGERKREEDMSDGERKEMIDFVHAAAEWGSTVLVPEREAERMMVLAERRRVADFEREERGQRRRSVHFEMDEREERGHGRERERERMVDISGLRIGGDRERESEDAVYGDGRRRR